jgi:hypothetical protein
MAIKQGCAYKFLFDKYKIINKVFAVVNIFNILAFVIDIEAHF